MLQRAIRRKDPNGKATARKLFGDTLSFRRSGVLGVETYMAHASLELDSNHEPQVALNIVEYARSALGVACSSVKFYKLHARILVALGDAKSLRWLFQFALAGKYIDFVTSLVLYFHFILFIR